MARQTVRKCFEVQKGQPIMKETRCPKSYLFGIEHMELGKLFCFHLLNHYVDVQYILANMENHTSQI